MKVILIAILFLTPLLGKTDQGVEIRTQQTLEMLNQSLATRSYENLSPEIKEEVLQHVLTALRTIRGDVIRPQPPIVVLPPPILVVTDEPGISFDVKSVAIVESTLLVFHSLDRGQIFQECMAGVRNINAIDEIALSSGSQKVQNIFNIPTFWSKQSACEIISNRLELNPNSLPKFSSVRGTIETTAVDFQGQSNADVLEQCALAVINSNNRISRNVDEKYLSFNQGAVKRIYNQASFWNGPTTICTKALETL